MNRKTFGKLILGTIASSQVGCQQPPKNHPVEDLTTKLTAIKSRAEAYRAAAVLKLSGTNPGFTVAELKRSYTQGSSEVDRLVGDVNDAIGRKQNPDPEATQTAVDNIQLSLGQLKKMSEGSGPHAMGTLGDIIELIKLIVTFAKWVKDEVSDWSEAKIQDAQNKLKATKWAAWVDPSQAPPQP